MPRGGKRVGAGRPRGKPTVVVRIPASQKARLETLGFKLPLYGSQVEAGFPSPADDYIESLLDLNEYLVKHPAATFLVRAKGESMLHAGIHPGDILVVDRSLEARHGKIVIAAVNGELTVKRLYMKDGVVKLQPENPSFPDIIITEALDTMVWGVVTNVIHQV